MWSGQFSYVHGSLQDGLMISEKWSSAAESLTTQFWKQYTPHHWKGGPFVSPTLTQLTQRLEEVSRWGWHISTRTSCFSDPVDFVALCVKVD